MEHGPQTVVTTSWDDGHPLDLKLADLLSEYQVKGTFYVCPHNRERAAMGTSQLRELGERFEIGAHTLTHPDLRRLSDEELEREVSGARQGLADTLGRPVDMFCYPMGHHSSRVREAVINAGFIGARTTRKFHLAPPKDPWLMPTTVNVKPWRSLVWFERSLLTLNWRGLVELSRVGMNRTWSQLACALFERTFERGGVWHLWGHSWEIEKRGLWDSLREVFETVSGREGVAYVTNGELVRMTTGSAQSNSSAY